MQWNAADPLSLFLACTISGLLIPVPEDLALLAAGWAIKTGEATEAPILLAGIAGVGLRDAIAFYAGRLVAGQAGRWAWLDRLARSGRVERARGMFVRHGPAMIGAARFAIGMRAPLYFAAGMLGTRSRSFLFADGIGLCLSTPLTLYLGWRFGDQAAAFLQEALSHQRALIGGGLVALLLYQLWRRRLPA